jgi:hypothetical protein
MWFSMNSGKISSRSSSWYSWFFIWFLNASILSSLSLSVFASAAALLAAS